MCGLANLDSLSRKKSERLVALVCLFTILITSIALAVAGDLSLALLGCVLSTALAGVLVMTGGMIPSLTVLVFAVPLGVLVIAGWRNSSLPAWAALLLGAIPTVLWATPDKDEQSTSDVGI